MYHLMGNEPKVYILLEKEFKLSKDEVAISRTDIDGNILYYNQTFIKISGYKGSDLLYAPHNIVRHPEMPKAIFFVIWKSLLAGRSTWGVVKNLRKDGNYYWLLINFIVQKDNQNRTISFLSEGRQVKEEIIKKVEPFYNMLLKEEKRNGMESSIRKLHQFFTTHNIASYNDYICSIKQERRYSFFSNLML